MKKLVFPLLFTFLSASAVAQNGDDNISVTYLPGKTEDEKVIAEFVKNSGINELVVEMGEEIFPFTNPLTIEYGSDDGPLFDPNKNVIQMPYSFMGEANYYFTKNKYDEKFGKPAQEGVLDTVLHTLIHEIGHAYIMDKKIPILGKEEDAVDNLAAIVMIEYFENGADSAISAADMFAFESEEMPEHIHVAEYIDEHSFNLQRYFATLCLVYGSDPEKYSGLLDEVGKETLADRQEFCVYNYQKTSDDWHTYLGHTK
ncbi:DUF4344 domain-containing metallopeptidase [Vibrio sp. SCSIO 43136]|uniref:DUF4344 domain-containing metallopeptidase n=1 Tax=Vibrio sp. SCSIO 43136 TaxID=2819101 RepID=UPI002075072A|nr:DUF4344 domain-containing metallopeptidase [Vibrio sp. SCSIO 43136]USD67700.1 hypothetical protein J4N39_16055 [Vibrio sp. SCSIO 43136]